MGTGDDFRSASSDGHGFGPAPELDDSPSGSGPAFRESWRKLARCIREVIKKRRVALGLTQQQLASRCGFSANYVSRLESEPHDVSLANFKRLAKSLEISSSDLMKEAEELFETKVFLDIDGDKRA